MGFESNLRALGLDIKCVFEELGDVSLFQGGDGKDYHGLDVLVWLRFRGSNRGGLITNTTRGVRRLVLGDWGIVARTAHYVLPYFSCHISIQRPCRYSTAVQRSQLGSHTCWLAHTVRYASNPPISDSEYIFVSVDTCTHAT
jgi:hypothetical protein